MSETYFDKLVGTKDGVPSSVLILSASGAPLAVQPNFVTPDGDTNLLAGRVATIPHTGTVTLSASLSMISGAGGATITYTSFGADGKALLPVRTIVLTDAAPTATDTIDTGMHQFVARVSAVTGQVGSVTLYGEGA